MSAFVPAIRKHAITEVEPEKLDLELVSPHFASTHASAIPAGSSVQSTRETYGSRFIDQAIAQKNAEAPWVQALSDDGENSFDELFGKYNGALNADDDGVVDVVDEDRIVWTDSQGKKRTQELFRNFPFNRKSALTQSGVVQPGQKITKGQLLAKSNFTDGNGTMALGMNARVAIVPYLGYTMDDAIVVSEDFAKRMLSEKTETLQQEFDDTVRGGREHFMLTQPSAFTNDQLKHIDEDGVVKPGTILKRGDPIILATRPKVMSGAAVHIGKLSRPMREARSNASQIWEGKEDAEVLDVTKNKNGTYKVLLKSYKPAEDGDKVVFRAGAKGTISRVIPQDQMPRTADGKPLDVLYNPMGLVSRANDQMIYETLLGKIAEKRGKPFKVPAYTKPGENWYDYVASQLKEAGLPDTEKIYDPKYNVWLENPVTVGNAYMLQLHHTAQSKAASRGSGGGYDANEQPTKGGDEGAKRVSGLEGDAMRSSGAVHNLREMSVLRGAYNPEYWQHVRKGIKPREPGSPFVFRKYRALLEGAGLRNKDLGDGRIRLGPMTDKRLDELDPIELRNGGIVNVNSPNLDPVPGGLFDPDLVATGKWGAFKLPQPVLNPAFSDAARKLLKLSKAELEDILAGRADLPEHLR